MLKSIQDAALQEACCLCDTYTLSDLCFLSQRIIEPFSLNYLWKFIRGYSKVLDLIRFIQNTVQFIQKCIYLPIYYIWCCLMMIMIEGKKLGGITGWIGQDSKWYRIFCHFLALSIYNFFFNERIYMFSVLCVCFPQFALPASTIHIHVVGRAKTWNWMTT